VTGAAFQLILANKWQKTTKIDHKLKNIHTIFFMDLVVLTTLSFFSDLIRFNVFVEYCLISDFFFFFFFFFFCFFLFVFFFFFFFFPELHVSLSYWWAD